MRKGRGPEGVIVDTPKKRRSNIATWVNNRNVAQTLTNDLRAMSGGLCVTIDDTHVWKEQALICDTRSLTWDERSHSQILLLWGLSDPSIAELCVRPQCSV